MHRTRRLVVIALALALMSVGCTASRPRATPPTPRASISLPLVPAGGVWAGVRGGWNRLTPPPAVRDDAVPVWTGREIVYWGGVDPATDEVLTDGFAYDPVTDAWRRIGDGPVALRSLRAAWTGTEILFYGKAGPLAGAGAWTGVAYDPAADRWRTLAIAPPSVGEPAFVLWTGSHLILLGAYSRAAPSRDGAAYDPVRDRWRAIARAPFSLNAGGAVWSGREVIVVGAELDGSNVSTTDTVVGEAYDPSVDTWRRLAAGALAPQATSVVWTGSAVFAWDYGLAAALYDAGADRWTSLPGAPLNPMECYNGTGLAGDVVFADYCGQAAVFDLATRRWTRLTPPASLAGGVFSAGDAVGFIGKRDRVEFWVYKP